MSAASVPATAAPRRRSWGSPWAWLIFLIGVSYFVIPLVSTIEFSLRAAYKDPVTGDFIRPSLAAYELVLRDPKFTGGLITSFRIALITIVVSLVLLVPTAYWVRLKVPRLRPVVELITLMPFVIPPVVLVFGLIRIYAPPPLALLTSSFGTEAVLVGAYVGLSFPYMYRAVDTGLATIDVRTLTEAAQSLGAGWPRILWSVIFPNLRGALHAGAFLTLAIVMGEYTIASFMSVKTFGPYLSLLGQNKAYEPAAGAIISFAITWAAMFAIVIVGRGSRDRTTIGGAR
ncbi:MAG: ABC transporter permease [Chloroflexota bacterium]